MKAVVARVLARLHVIPMEIGPERWPLPDAPLRAYSPYAHVPGSDREALVAAAAPGAPLDRALGCLVGMAVGDAAGAPLEFLPTVDRPGETGHELRLDALTYDGAINRFRLLPGQWTDDAAMGLCIADSLIVRRGYDGADIRTRFWNWWFRGYNNAFRHDPGRAASVGLGGNVGRSLLVLRPGERPPPRCLDGGDDAGIGALMRLAPIPIFFQADPLRAARMGAESSATTHPGPIAAEACAFLAYVLARAVRGELGTLEQGVAEYLAVLAGRAGPGVDDLRRLLAGDEPEDGLERCWNWRAPSLDLAGTLARRGDAYRGHPVDPAYFGSFCLDGLAMAMHAVHHAGSFAEAVVRCANFLGDADSTAAIAGQLAGALHGHAAIDPRMRQALARWDDGEVALRAALLHELGAER